MSTEKPFVDIERGHDGWEVNVGIDDGVHDAITIFFADDGSTELKRFTQMALEDNLTAAIIEAIEAIDR